MKLLVSVRSTAEAESAHEGGAEIIDAKEPSKGALARVDASTLCGICAVGVSVLTPVSVALGDIRDYGGKEHAIVQAAQAASDAGAAFVKLGSAGARNAIELTRILSRMRIATSAGVIAVAYADAEPLDRISLDDLLDAVIAADAAGVLVDTTHKGGASLFDLLKPTVLREWAARAHDETRIVALAGSLRQGSFGVATDCGVDIVGVRGAVCIGGRSGVVSVGLVRAVAREVSEANQRRALTDRAVEPQID